MPRGMGVEAVLVTDKIEACGSNRVRRNGGAGGGGQIRGDKIQTLLKNGIT